MPYIPLSARRTMFEERTTELEVLLVTIDHPDLASPIYLSSDPTERLSTDPLVYGTISNAIEYQFVLMGAVLPDDRKGSSPRTAITFDNIEATFVELARSFTEPATVDLAVVFASAPDLVTQSYTGLRMTRVTYDESSMTFDISREPYLNEPFGARQTKNFFPGLHGLPSS
jgi:hypothetical protein